MKTHYIKENGKYRLCDNKEITKQDIMNLTNTEILVTCKKCLAKIDKRKTLKEYSGEKL